MSCEPFDCTQCGMRHERCTQHSVKCSECGWSGGNHHAGDACTKCEAVCVMRPCQKWPLRKMSVCEAHGGGNVRSKVASARYAEEAELNKLLKIEGHVEPVHDPYSFLASIAGELELIKTQLGRRVQDLPSLEDVGTEKYATQLSVTMQAYERFLTHCARIGTDMSRLDLDSKIARLTAAIDAETASIVTSALESGLSAIALDPEQRSIVLQAFGQALRQPALKA